MKKSILISLLAAGFVACQSEKPEKKVTVIKPDDSEKVRSLIIGDPLDCGLEGVLMFPIGTSYDPQVYEPPPEPKEESGTYHLSVSDNNGSGSYEWSNATNANLTFAVNTGTAYDKLALKEYVNNSTNEFDITNILFYNLETGESYPLIKNDTLHIISFAIHKEFENDLIFYRVVKTDYNADEKFNGMDPVMLYVSDLAGEQLIQVTPNNQQFLDYTYYRDNQKILAKMRIDTDQDTLYTPADETNFVEMNLNSPAYGKPLFPDSLKNILKGQLNI